LVLDATHHSSNASFRSDDSGCRLSDEQVGCFSRNGYLGPLVCADRNVLRLPDLLFCAGVRNHGTNEPVPDPATWTTTDVLHVNVHDPHRHVPEIMAICAHPSIVIPVSQVLGCQQVAFFQSRFRAKFPHQIDPVPWHQDVGKNSGGYRSDGSPVPSVTVWLSVDGASDERGTLRVVPGTHSQLIGDWKSGFAARLEESGAVNEAELQAKSMPMETDPGEYFLLHSWTLHRSTANLSTSPRSALVLRYVTPEDAVLPKTDYTLLPR
jgi:ectoine hydroxylase-related dioxygenase (phytanoyl-CoA dioxygenase family)